MHSLLMFLLVVANILVAGVLGYLIGRRPPKTCDSVLDILAAFFNNHNGHGEAEKLWWVLTALRGPDSDDLPLKEATTAVIRHVALRGAVIQAVSNADSPAHSEFRRKLFDNLSSSRHFTYHAEKAFETLRLFWHVDND